MNSAEHIKEERDFYVTARDGKDIAVRYASSKNNTTNQAVILAHGITGRPSEYIHMYARNFFTEKGYDVYRMSFYDDADNARKMHTTTLPLQANDMNDVVSHAKDNHDKVYVCGHSYGGATILFAQPKVDALAFWDSAFDVQNFWNLFTKDTTSLDHALINTSWRINQLFSKEMMAHAQSQTEEDMKNLTNSIVAPSIVITAEKDDNLESGQKIFKHLSCEKEYQEIKNADHRFLIGDTTSFISLACKGRVVVCIFRALSASS